jgi:RNA polymerase sigma-70 factor (ECF subfamily)
MGIALHRGLRTLQAVGNRLPIVGRFREVEQEIHEPWSEAEAQEWVTAALAMLPADQRLVLELAYRLGHSCSEIARSMDCPVNTVKTRMYYGRQKLKRILPDLAGLSAERSTRHLGSASDAGKIAGAAAGARGCGCRV